MRMKRVQNTSFACMSYREGGLWPAVALIPFIGLISYFSVKLLILSKKEICKKKSITTFAEIGEHCFGKAGELILALISFR
jgi:amino acid permease